MPLYEYKTNAENRVSLPKEQVASYVTGTAAVADAIIARARAGQSIGLDGWYGVDFAALEVAIGAASKRAGVSIAFIHTAPLFRSPDEIARYRSTYETDDPSFGWVNTDGVLTDIMNSAAIDDVAARLASGDPSAISVVLGPGALVDGLSTHYALKVYVDFTMQPMLWQMWGGELVTFGRTEPDTDYYWKRYYYCDFYLLYRQKKAAFQKMDLFVDGVDSANLKMLPKAAYESMIDEVVKQPIKQVKILQPGPWGAYRYRDLWNVEGLECNAWNELAGIELSVLIQLGDDLPLINVPAQNIMQRPIQMVGEYVHKTYPDLMPLQVWLDDGYFPEPVSWERSSMPIHNHPGTDYVKRNFNEPLGRYETYYIVESYKGSSTWMGYKETADVEEWERKCRDSNNLKVIDDWEDYICRWDTNVGDLFLIPPGTTHGHGGNQMILEMDTGPSVAGTEYSFFTYDFARKTWDDTKKTMTAPPMRMHLDHSFRNQKWIRESRVMSHHRARPVTVDGNGRFRKDQYTTLPEMPFHIERIFMEETAESDTDGRFMQIVTLTEGEHVTIESIDNPQYRTTIERLQGCIIPAGFGRHRYINESGRHAMVVIIRLKVA